MFAVRGRRFRYRLPRGSEFSPPFWSNEQTLRDGLGQCEREFAGRSDSLLWLDGEGDTPGKSRIASSPQKRSRTIAGREGKQNGSPRRHGLLDRYIMRSQRKTVSALRDQFQITLQVGNAEDGALDSFVQWGSR
jgi:hypothetical protein